MQVVESTYDQDHADENSERFGIDGISVLMQPMPLFMIAMKFV
jgi:hypothetical protein